MTSKSNFYLKLFIGQKLHHPQTDPKYIYVEEVTNTQIEMAKNQEKLIGILPISAWEARALVSTFNAKPSGGNDLIQFRDFFRLFATINKQSLFEIDCGRIKSFGFGS